MKFPAPSHSKEGGSAYHRSALLVALASKDHISIYLGLILEARALWILNTIFKSSLPYYAFHHIPKVGTPPSVIWWYINAWSKYQIINWDRLCEHKWELNRHLRKDPTSVLPYEGRSVKPSQLPKGELIQLHRNTHRHLLISLTAP